MLAVFQPIGKRRFVISLGHPTTGMADAVGFLDETNLKRIAGIIAELRPAVPLIAGTQRSAEPNFKSSF
jgi:hypothetical protein